jgi:hypothetical protein
MWKPLRITTLWVSTASFRDSFNFYSKYRNIFPFPIWVVSWWFHIGAIRSPGVLNLNKLNKDASVRSNKQAAASKEENYRQGTYDSEEPFPSITDVLR